MTEKNQTRNLFRSKVFERDKGICAVCGLKPENVTQLDAHHITDRNLIPFGGYVPANGITLCTERCELAEVDCHLLAEMFHSTGNAAPGYSPNDLYATIGSSYRNAFRDSLSLSLDEETIQDKMLRLTLVEKTEEDVCLVLNTVPNTLTWELACERTGESCQFIIGYGKGRYVKPDN